MFVMAGQSRPKDGVAFARLCPAIHVFLAAAIRRGCPGTIPGMTDSEFDDHAVAGSGVIQRFEPP
jgi:hypothetical protein